VQHTSAAVDSGICFVHLGADQLKSSFSDRLFNDGTRILNGDLAEGARFGADISTVRPGALSDVDADDEAKCPDNPQVLGAEIRAPQARQFLELWMERTVLHCTDLDSESG
jgi:hypothetical protein